MPPRPALVDPERGPCRPASGRGRFGAGGLEGALGRHPPALGTGSPAVPLAVGATLVCLTAHWLTLPMTCRRPLLRGCYTRQVLELGAAAGFVMGWK